MINEFLCRSGSKPVLTYIVGYIFILMIYLSDITDAQCTNRYPL